jgi:hypothetical protein
MVSQNGHCSWSGPIVFGTGAPHFGQDAAESETSFPQSLHVIKAIAHLILFCFGCCGADDQMNGNRIEPTPDGLNRTTSAKDFQLGGGELEPV